MIYVANRSERAWTPLAAPPHASAQPYSSLSFGAVGAFQCFLSIRRSCVISRNHTARLLVTVGAIVLIGAALLHYPTIRKISEQSARPI